MKICVLGSGSSGNCIFVRAGTVGLLIDSGLTGRETERRLEEIGESISNISAVCVTHEHDDHVRSLRMIQKRSGADIYANSGTVEALGNTGKTSEIDWSIFTTGSDFSIGGINILPFPVPHDSYDPVGFCFVYEGLKFGLATDIGIVTELVKQRLRDCDVLIIESNHDSEMLRNSARPWVLKQRISGIQGHLSNDAAADLVCSVAGSNLKYVFLTHLSSDCNTQYLAHDCMMRALKQSKREDIKIIATYPDRVSEIVDIN